MLLRPMASCQVSPQPPFLAVASPVDTCPPSTGIRHKSTLLNGAIIASSCISRSFLSARCPFAAATRCSSSAFPGGALPVLKTALPSQTGGDDSLSFWSLSFPSSGRRKTRVSPSRNSNPNLNPTFVARARTNGRAQSGDESESEGEKGMAARKVEDFVGWFREAWPYIQGHRGSTFVLVLPGEVVEHRARLDSMLQDVALMHGLGVKLVIVPGTHLQIDELLEERGLLPRFHGAYRVTDDGALEAAMEAAGRIRVQIEARLSRGPSIPVLRRHGETDKWHNVGLSVTSGNFVFAKRRGVVDGVDFGFTGEVKKVDVNRIKERLESNCVVLLSNLGFSSGGEVLNCNTYEVATACATALQADKLVCMLDGPVCDDNGRQIRFMTLQQADLLIRQRASQSSIAGDYVRALAGADYAKALGLDVGVKNDSKGKSGVFQYIGGVGELSKEDKPINDEDKAASIATWNAQRALYSMEYEKPAYSNATLGTAGVPVLGVGVVGGSGSGSGNGSRSGSGGIKSNGNGKVDGGGGKEGEKRGEEGGGFAIGGEERLSRTYGYLSELTAAVFACRAGVRRVHLLDSTLEGSMLLELYTRDGIGTMISSDLYEGTRAAQVTDISGISKLLAPLEEAGILIHRTYEQELPFFTVVERDAHIIACAALFPFPLEAMAEVAAFAVSPEARGHGRGDSLLDYLEKRALEMDIQKLFLLTTRTADWFVQRGFSPCEIEELPPQRVARINRSRNSKAFMKDIRDLARSGEELEEEKGLPTDLPKYGPPVAL